MQRLIVISSSATALMTTTLMSAVISAQSTNAVRLQIAPGSQLSFEGTSTLHGFTCTTKTMQAYVDVDPAYRTADLTTLTHPIIAVQVVIPVKSLACGGELENNMFKTLNATKYPYIIYTLLNYDVVSGSASATGFAADTHGRLTISGKENAIAMRVDATRNAEGTVSARGEQAIKMSDFGVKPPTFMLGTLRVGNELKVRFTLKATPGAVATAITQLGGNR
ncbi:MAG: YceI family protein [Gemmatimonadaceae bacterium]